MGVAFVALKRGRLARPPTAADPFRLLGGQGGFEDASPQRAEEEEGTNGGWRAGEQVTEKPTQTPGLPTRRPPLIPSATSAPFQGNPEGCKLLGNLSALLAQARPLRVSPLHSRLEISPKSLQQRPPPFNQWFSMLDLAK
jgi:hypothetical protein